MSRHGDDGIWEATMRMTSSRILDDSWVHDGDPRALMQHLREASELTALAFEGLRARLADGRLENDGTDVDLVGELIGAVARGSWALARAFNESPAGSTDHAAGAPVARASDDAHVIDLAARRPPVEGRARAGDQS